jgi:hypothetical protein
MKCREAVTKYCLEVLLGVQGDTYGMDTERAESSSRQASKRGNRESP